MSMSASIFVDPPVTIGRKISERISILATELTVVEKYITLGFHKCNDIILTKRQSELDKEIIRLEHLMGKHTESHLKTGKEQ